MGGNTVPWRSSKNLRSGEMTIGALIRLIMGIAGTVAVRAAVQVGAREAVKYGLKSQREKNEEKEQK